MTPQAEAHPLKRQDVSFTLHLQELRKRIIICLAAFAAAFGAAFFFVQELYGWLVRDVEGKLTILAPSDVLWVYMVLSGVAAAAAAIPVAAWQAWLFVKPALRPHEHKATLAFIPALALLFAVGLCFGYFIVYPMVVSFLEELSFPFATMYTADNYFSFMIHMTVPFGVLFEMPVIVLFLTQVGLLSPERLTKLRKPAYFLLAVAAIAITPPDPVSDVLVIIPLFLLYELSAVLCKAVQRNKMRRSAAV